ncbi:MAG: PD40 domain-containing protein [Cyclobacteriaceae bacterium]|nr:PD40 domain-containing protein [Cyclobacteriaceae bacterium]
MRRRFAFSFICVVAVIFSANELIGQNNPGAKALQNANKLFSVRNFKEAIPEFETVVQSGSANAEVHYKLGKSYASLDHINERIKGIAHYEKAEQMGISPLPPNFYLDLGDLYFQDEQIKNSIAAYEKYHNNVRDARQKTEVKLKILQAQNALEIMRSERNVSIKQLEPNVNTEYTEYNPVVSADESIMAFTGLRPNTGRTRTGEKMIEEIFISQNQLGAWSVPQKVDIKVETNLGTAGLSADGQEMIIYLQTGPGNGDLFIMRKEGTGWSRPVTMGENINTRFNETTASLTPDGKTLYFASDRPGGYGGLDIYKAEKQADGSWGKAVNLGPNINSKYNEDAPFIHPNQQILFFTSNNPEKSIGGNDILKADLQPNGWGPSVNMGYPINTTSNDNYFTLIADGSRGYFSSDRKGSMGGQDIYKLEMPEDYETIPLTMIKGRILDAETHKPLKTKIYMIDNKTKEKIDYVYNPNPETGDYLVILPPNKNYDMIIESDGFLPYTLNIDVPNQTFFYQLYQKIFLKTIRQFDVVVGQEVEVKNAFYNTQKEQVKENRKDFEAQLIRSDSIDAYELMSSLIEAGDQQGIDYLVELLARLDPLDAVEFDEGKNDKLQAAKRIYYFDESDESKFEQKVVDGQTIFSLPTMFVTKEAREQKIKAKEIIAAEYDKKLLNKTVKIYFDAGKSELDKKYLSELNVLLEALRNNQGLGIEISGFASQEGDADFNKKLSNERAIAVLNYINTRGVVRRRIIAKGYGATKDESASKEEGRRVEAKIVELNLSLR